VIDTPLKLPEPSVSKQNRLRPQTLWRMLTGTCPELLRNLLHTERATVCIRSTPTRESSHKSIANSRDLRRQKD
jgi:hypothetical protein